MNAAGACVHGHSSGNTQAYSALLYARRPLWRWWHYATLIKSAQSSSITVRERYTEKGGKRRKKSNANKEGSVNKNFAVVTTTKLDCVLQNRRIDPFHAYSRLEGFPIFFLLLLSRTHTLAHTTRSWDVATAKALSLRSA